MSTKKTDKIKPPYNIHSRDVLQYNQEHTSSADYCC